MEESRMERTDYARARRLHAEGGNGPGRVSTIEEAPIGELFKRLGNDAGDLVRGELELARAELRESAKQMTRAASRFALALGLAIPGMLALAAFAIIALGDALENYWLSALIVGVIFLIMAAGLGKRAMTLVGEGKANVQETAETVRHDAEWAKEEVKAFKRELTA
jgi:uncharacterized membrane protein YqjE